MKLEIFNVRNSKLRKTVLLTLTSMLLASALTVLSPQTSSATTVVNAHRPETAYGLVFGTVDRNDDCRAGYSWCIDLTALRYDTDFYLFGEFHSAHHTLPYFERTSVVRACSFWPGYWSTSHIAWDDYYFSDWSPSNPDIPGNMQYCAFSYGGSV